MFICDCCGCCCRNLNKSPLYAELDSGNGTCKYLIGNLCSIYDQRPLLCRIDDCYELFFKNSMEREKFYKLNMLVCENLKTNEEE